MTSEHSTSSQRPHRHRRKLWVAGIVGLTGLFIWLAQPSEPQYAGESLSHWLGKRNQSSFHNPATEHFVISETQGQPVWEMGEAAVPFLIKRLKAGLAAAKWSSRLPDLGWKSPFRMIGEQLDERSQGMKEAYLGFFALREKAAKAIPALVSLVPLNEQNAEVILDSIASIGAPGVVAISNALIGPSLVVQVAAARSAGLLKENGAPLVPLLISMLGDPNALDTSRCAAARSLGMIGRPVEVVALALQDALVSTNGTIRANAVVGLTMMRGSAKPAIPRIEEILLRETNQLSYAMVVGLVVLCEDDTQIERTLSRFQSHAAIPANNAERRGTALRKNLSAIRDGWNSQSEEGWESYRSAVDRIVFGSASK